MLNSNHETHALPHLNLSFVSFKRITECVSVQNFVAIDQTVAEIWLFFGFSKMAAVRHLGFVMHMLGPPMKGI